MQYLRNQWSDFKKFLKLLESNGIQCIHCALIIEPNYRVKVSIFIKVLVLKSSENMEI